MLIESDWLIESDCSVGEKRNDLYLSLLKGRFERDGKTADRNVEARVIVVDNRSGSFVKVFSAYTHTVKSVSSTISNLPSYIYNAISINVNFFTNHMYIWFMR